MGKTGINLERLSPLKTLKVLQKFVFLKIWRIEVMEIIQTAGKDVGVVSQCNKSRVTRLGSTTAGVLVSGVGARWVWQYFWTVLVCSSLIQNKNTSARLALQYTHYDRASLEFMWRSLCGTICSSRCFSGTGGRRRRARTRWAEARKAPRPARPRPPSPPIVRTARTDCAFADRAGAAVVKIISLHCGWSYGKNSLN